MWWRRRRSGSVGPDLCRGLLPTFPHNAAPAHQHRRAAELRVALLPSFSLPANWVCSQQRGPTPENIGNPSFLIANNGQFQLEAAILRYCYRWKTTLFLAGMFPLFGDKLSFLSCTNAFPVLILFRKFFLQIFVVL